MSRNEPINRSELAERLDSDFDLFRELTDLFIDDSASLMGRIKNSIDSGDMESLRKNAHTLKGAVSNFSAQGAYDAAFELETAGRNSCIDGLADKYTALENEIQAVIQDMKSILEKGSF
ncbi:MAG TPA: Hpt domain-containing protein [Spirochaetota bacterium]|nr:Hpt domain-containing protein [Spirochaetota bacterium]